MSFRSVLCGALLFPMVVLSVDAVAAVDPANVNAPVASSTVPALNVPNMSPEVSAQVAELLASLPPGPTGDAATACEVILCLAGSAGAGGRVAECVPPIRKYLTSFAPPRLFSKRLNFLKLCPKVSGQGDARMENLVEIMARAPGIGNEGRICSSAAINRVNTRPLGEGEYYIAPDMPSDCAAYYAHDYTDLMASVPVYIGEPMDGGFWAEPEDQASAQARYDAEREQRRRDSGDRQQRSAYSNL